ECPDPDRLEALKAMFFSVNSVKTVDAEKILAYQLFQIAKQLTSGQILLLKACYSLAKARTLETIQQEKQTNRSFQAGVRPTDWINPVFEYLGHDVSSLIEQDADRLQDLRLLAKLYPSGMVPPQNGRLTDLGMRFCNNIMEYDVERQTGSE
ncbi:MAG: hypothetical protein WA655_14175, partial [Candidatus Korobacteraceae bacterium]